MHSLIANIILFFTLLMTISTSQAACIANDTGTQTQTLYAGQTIDIGVVTATINNNHLHINYITDNNWSLQEVHVWAGDDIAEMPQTRKGTPKIGGFPYADTGLDGVSNYTVNIPLANLGVSCPDVDRLLYVAAHAAVVKIDDNGAVLQSETAWADGDLFVQKGMWGTFFNVGVSCECDLAGTTDDKLCQTAFAYSGGSNAVDSDFTNSFLAIDEDGDTVADFNRWGWSNGSISVGHYIWDIYAGAAQSDISKGSRVGSLTVDYNGDTADISYQLDFPFYLQESHLYVGAEMLGRDENQNMTVAPGQYPYMHEQLNMAISDQYQISGLTGSVYIIAHGIVCGFEWFEGEL